MAKVKAKIDGLDAWVDKILKDAETKQTENLVNYAKEQMASIGAKFVDWEANGNLLDSLCWGVYFKKKLHRFGYYRGAQAFEDSILHALSSRDKQVKVNGRALAEQFLAQYKPTAKWEVVWAVLAPYWAYWEKGHYNRLMGTMVRFEIMAQAKDQIDKDLTDPAKVYLEINIPD